jgi:predicted nucleic-acid-binding protein
MIGIDTNILVRLLVSDDAQQAHAADALVNAPERADDPMLVSPIVLVEIEWALRKLYDRTKTQILEAIDRLLDHAHVIIDDREAVEAAIAAWRTGKADFADYLIGALARERGARTTMTFDRKAAESSVFTLLPH